jgi:predicted PolB exonuclease-like 3'-5' exonuclease
MTSTITFDLETLPAGPDLIPLLQELYAKSERKISFEDYHRGTSLNANFGSIFCIGYAIDDQPAQVLTGDEPDLLRQFWQISADTAQLIGHHIIEFDLPFLVKRSRLHGLVPSHDFDWPAIRAGQQRDRIFDTKREWECWAGGSGAGLDTLAKLFGLPTSKQGIDGSQVYSFWQAGRHQEIYDYCARDVELTRRIAQRLLPPETN